jgi:ribonucleotide monophosphatase NagD (HAD superfamily)
VPRVLAIGDGIPTDVKGANAQELDCLFVARGIHAGELRNPLDAAEVAALLAKEDAFAAFALDALRP